MTRPVAALVARRALALTGALAAIAACTTTSSKAPADSSTTSTSVTTTSTSVSATSAPDTMWRTLFDGSSMAAFRGYKMDSMPKGWTIANGVMTKTGSTEDIVTRDEFGNFELALDWKISPGGNAGIFYRANEKNDKVYMSGPEYQLLDDAKHPDGKSRLTSAAADYGLYASPAGIVKPANEWNAARIVVRGNHVEHWLNGQKVVEYELGSPDWEAKVKASKFVAWKDYGREQSGHIGIQGDHDGGLAIRNVRIRVLP
jgi:hypothetical protein